MRWIVVTSLASSLLLAAPAMAQASRDARGTRTAYGARLTTIGRNNASATSAKANRRLDTRLNSRIDNRIERYVTDDDDPTTAVVLAQDRLTKQAAPVQPMPQSENDP